jgi:hypothetical protein
MFCNENAKIPAFASIVPARDHDELQGFDPMGPHASHSNEYLLIFWRDQGDDARESKRFDAMREMFEQKISIREIQLPQGSRSSQLLFGWRLMQETTRLFAIAHGIDPNTNAITEEFKKRLA